LLKYINLAGKTYNRWVVLEKDFSKLKNEAYWICKCDCGNIRSISAYNLKKGKSKSCGCLQKEYASILGKTKIKHGMINTKEYKVWSGMKTRCYNKNRDAYKYYGGRGIVVCKRWIESFENFFNDMGPIEKDKCTIERLDNDGNYEPENCVWASWEEQQNNRRSNRVIVYNGEKRNIGQWLKYLCIGATLFYSELAKGKTEFEIFNNERKW
jgi:hypothetical protein